MQRVAWTCPQCGKRFAIPSQSDLPEACPECAASDNGSDVVPLLPVVDSELRHRERQRYLLARMLVMTFRILGGIALLAAIGALIAGLVTVSVNDAGPERSRLIWICLGWFGGAAVSGLGFLGGSEGIRILLDIEEHTYHAATKENDRAAH